MCFEKKFHWKSLIAYMITIDNIVVFFWLYIFESKQHNKQSLINLINRARVTMAIFTVNLSFLLVYE